MTSEGLMGRASGEVTDKQMGDEPSWHHGQAANGPGADHRGPQQSDPTRAPLCCGPLLLPYLLRSSAAVRSWHWVRREESSHSGQH